MVYYAGEDKSYYNVLKGPKEEELKEEMDFNFKKNINIYFGEMAITYYASINKIR